MKGPVCVGAWCRAGWLRQCRGARRAALPAALLSGRGNQHAGGVDAGSPVFPRCFEQHDADSFVAC